jgi:hypothetical protein
MSDGGIEHFRVDGQGNRIADTCPSKAAIVEFIPPIKLSGLVELNKRKMSTPAVTIVLEALRRHKTKQRDLKLSVGQCESLGLTKKQARVALDALRSKATDLVTVSQSGHEAATVSITGMGWRVFDPKAKG